MSTSSCASMAWTRPPPNQSQRDSFDDDPLGSSPAESTSSLFAAMTVYGTSPDSPLPPFFQLPSMVKRPAMPISAATQPIPCVFARTPTHASTCGSSAATARCCPETTTGAEVSTPNQGNFLQMSLGTLLGCCEMLGHQMENRSDIARQQDVSLLADLQGASTVPLRDASQQPLFVVAPLDVLVTREHSGRNQFHIIEINGTGISGLTNMTDVTVEDVLRSFSELAHHMAHPDALVLVASSGQETYPPVSRTLHEKMLYVEALKRGFEASGRRIHITNMTRLEKRPDSMPPSGPTVVLGYMKQFRANFMMDSPTGRLMLFGRQVHAAINDRFMLNTCYQFNHRLDLLAFKGYNAGYAAGADKGVAYELYNQFFGSEDLGSHFTCMAPAINFRRARTRTELISTIQAWLQCSSKPAVIKPQGTGCGHGIEFFFGRPSWSDTAAKVDRALHSVASNYNLQCGGLPYTVCEYLDTATIEPPSTSSTSTSATTSAASAPAPTTAIHVTPSSCSVGAASDPTPCASRPLGFAGNGDGAAVCPTGAGGGDVGGGDGGGEAAVLCSKEGSSLPSTPPPLPHAQPHTRTHPHANKAGHKFELRIVVYRSGLELRAFPSIAKVAREAFDPLNPDNKKSLINNITTSAKETAQSGQEFLLPLCNLDTLAVLGISPPELRQLCAACTAFMRYVVDQVQDDPHLFGLPSKAV